MLLKERNGVLAPGIKIQRTKSKQLCKMSVNVLNIQQREMSGSSFKIETWFIKCLKCVFFTFRRMISIKK